jgi:hypothetical protein
LLKIDEDKSLILENLPETTLDLLEMTLAARSGSATTNRLGRPLIGALASCRESARGASVLLDVIGGAATTTAQRVRLVMALAKRRRSLCHFRSELDLMMTLKIEEITLNKITMSEKSE